MKREASYKLKTEKYLIFPFTSISVSYFQNLCRKKDNLNIFALISTLQIKN